MVFACQLDSFQKALVSKVVSCSKGEDTNFYEVICEDSILFPEGGGQPYDTGFINGIPVYEVLRKGPCAVFYVKEPFEVGQEVKQEVNWERRFDHMQQHSGQHLITAVINETYKFDTTSWWLGEKVSHIELNTPKVTQEQIENIEKMVNQKIMEEVPVVVKMCELGDKALSSARTRGLPDDVTGPIRIVEIVGLEDDLCCGTHVNNLIQLQYIKILYAEKGKKNKTNLFFLSGGRVIKHLTECLSRERKLTELLKNEPASHVELTEKLIQNLKVTNKRLLAAQKELGTLEGEKFNKMSQQPQYYFLYNKDADQSYMDSFLRTVKENNCAEKTLFVLGVGGENNFGHIVLHGQPEIVRVLGPKLADSLGGKGVAHGSRFQAKVSKFSEFPKAESIVQAHFQNANVNGVGQ